MDARNIARWRLHSQRLAGVPARTAEDVVGGLTCVQAENYSQAGWAVAARTTVLNQTHFDTLIDSGSILRTHVLRPTWHFVLPDDIVWIAQVTSPRIRRSIASQQEPFGVTDDHLDRGAELIVRLLDGGQHMTRDAIAVHLREAGLPAEGQALGTILMFAEISALICSGATDNGAQTFALIGERAPDARQLDRDEALYELALRYFTSHGPATERDLSYWASLTLTDVRKGLSLVGDQLESFDHEGRTFRFRNPPPDRTEEPRGHLLQILDEFYRGYQESRYLLDSEGIVPKGREASTGMALVNGQMVGGMRRRIQADTVTFEVLPFRQLKPHEIQILTDAGDRYGNYLGLEPKVVIG